MSGGRRVPWFGLFGRQVARDIALHVLIVAGASITLFISIDSVEAVNKSIRPEARFLDLVQLELYNVPGVLQQFGSVAVLIGTTTAIAALVRRQEIVAIFSAGAPPAVIWRPALIAGIAIGLLYAAMLEWVAPAARIEVSTIRRRLGLPPPPSDALNTSRTWFRGQDLVYRVKFLDDPRGGILSGVLMLRIKDGRLLDRWDVDRLLFREGRWLGEGVVHRAFGGVEEMHTTRSEQSPMSVEERPEDFVRSIGAPERLPYFALLATTRARERLGQPAIAHRLELYRRHAHPLVMLAAVTLSAAVALRIGRRPSIARSLGFGSIFGFALWITEELALGLGTSGAIRTDIAAHLPLAAVTFAAVVAWMSVLRQGIRT